MWNGQEFQNMLVHMDLAVCLSYSSDIIAPTACLPTEHLAKPYYAISKSSRFEQRKGQPFMLSGSNLENQILERLPINAKRGLILAKAVRITSIAKHDKDLSSTFCFSEDVAIDDLITSHMLKSCMLKGRLNGNCDVPTAWAIAIYKTLEYQLLQKEVRSWMSAESHLLDCRKCTAVYGCCLKRKLMLAMTRNILQWLQGNKAQLQGIDYADSCDHCDVKTTVYQLSDVRTAWWNTKKEYAKIKQRTVPHVV